MAIIRSLAIGKGRKSAGNITFRTVRGRTIVSEKVGPRDPATRGEGETVYQFMFAVISRFISMHRFDINVSFDKSKYGSQGNYFYKVNKAGLEAAVQPLFSVGVSSGTITNAQIEAAITEYATANPTNIYRVKKTGETVKYLTGEWTSDDNPNIPTKDAYIEDNGVQYAITIVEGTAQPTKVKALNISNFEAINAESIGDAGLVKAMFVDASNDTLSKEGGNLERVNANRVRMSSAITDPTGDPPATTSMLCLYTSGNTVWGWAVFK